MKKFLSLVLAVCLIVPCALMLTACGNNLEMGKKYTISNVSLNWANDTEKTEILDGHTEQELMERFDNGTYITFNKNGTVVIGMPQEGADDQTQTMYYTKKGKTVTLYQDEEKQNESGKLTIKGDKLVQTVQLGGSDKESTAVIEYSK